MKTSIKLTALGVVAVAIVAVLVVKKRTTAEPTPSESAASAESAAEVVASPADAAVSDARVPRLVSLGAGQCIPCKMMEPIREELRQECGQRMTIEFHDVWKDPAVGKAYGVRVIPTLIFYDATGKELDRHEGFISKDDIRAKWRSLGVDLGCGQHS